MKTEQILAALEAKHQGEKEYLQAVKEVLLSIEEVYNQHPEFEKAKAENMPKSNIQNAIDKAKNKGNGEDYEQVRYEGYGPSGMAIMIDCLTDNRNRTAGFVRSTLTKRGGNLGTDGSVSYLFKRKGRIIL